MRRRMPALLLGLVVFLLSCSVLVVLPDLLPLYGATEGGGDALLSLVLRCVGFLIAIGAGIGAARIARSRLTRA